MTLARVIYASTPFGFDEGMLNGILADARRCNTRDGITGALASRADLYLQLLEGPGELVPATYARIAEDPRRLDVTCLASGPTAARLFPDWAMRDDPARSWMWSQAEVAAGAVRRATSAEALAVFERLAAETA